MRGLCRRISLDNEAKSLYATYRVIQYIPAWFPEHYYLIITY